METLRLAAVIGAVMLTAVPVMAQSRMSMPSFEQLDADSSGGLSLEAFRAGLEQHREATIDQTIARMMEHADENGMLDEAALRAGLAEMRPGARSEQRAERRADMTSRLFSRIDRNDDGVIDEAEYQRFAEMMSKRGQNTRPRWRGQD
jgi:Ca2+-binding EF-hand superfamily protein